MWPAPPRFLCSTQARYSLPARLCGPCPSAPHRLLIVSVCNVCALDRGSALRAGLRRPRSTSSPGLARHGAQRAVLSGGNIQF